MKQVKNQKKLDSVKSQLAQVNSKAIAGGMQIFVKTLTVVTNTNG